MSIRHVRGAEIKMNVQSNPSFSTPNPPPPHPHPWLPLHVDSRKHIRFHSSIHAHVHTKYQACLSTTNVHLNRDYWYSNIVLY